MRVTGRVHDGTGLALLLPAIPLVSSLLPAAMGRASRGRSLSTRRGGERRWVREEVRNGLPGIGRGSGRAWSGLSGRQGLGACRTPEPSETPRRCRGRGERPLAQGSPEGRAHPSGPAEGSERVRESGASPGPALAGQGVWGFTPGERQPEHKDAVRRRLRGLLSE